jgi:hypothetical protein
MNTCSKVLGWLGCPIDYSIEQTCLRPRADLLACRSQRAFASDLQVPPIQPPYRNKLHVGSWHEAEAPTQVRIVLLFAGKPTCLRRAQHVSA